jgi:hypothetical protein
LAAAANGILIANDHPSPNRLSCDRPGGILIGKRSAVVMAVDRLHPSRPGRSTGRSHYSDHGSQFQTEKTARKTDRSRDYAKIDVFAYIKCFCNPRRRHSTIGISRLRGGRL